MPSQEAQSNAWSQPETLPPLKKDSKSGIDTSNTILAEPATFWKIKESNTAGNIEYPTNSLAFLNTRERTLDIKPSETTSSVNHRKSHPNEGLAYSDPAWQQNFRKAHTLLDVVIVGAGLGGLATAISLRLSGHSVSVFEQAAEFGEVGAGIQVPPNSTKHLLAWGVGRHIEPHISEPFGINVRQYKDGSLIGHTKLKPDFLELYDAPYWMLHRADYHASLLARAKELGVVVCAGHKVAEFDFHSREDRVIVQFENNDSVTADLVIGADGVKSICRKEVMGSHKLPTCEPIPTGQAAYRATIPLSIIASNPETSWIVSAPNQNMWIGPSRHCVTYPIRGKNHPERLFNLVLSHAESRSPEEWSTSPEVTRTEMQKNFQDFEPKVAHVIRLLSEHEKAKVVKWPIVTMEPLKTWRHASNKLILLGDAAHTMQPYMSQGAAMAVEDGAAIAAVLCHMTNKDQIPLALKSFEEARKARTRGMQQASWLNGEIWHLEDGELQRRRDESMGAAWIEEHGWSSNQWEDPLCRHWTFSHDAVGEVLKTVPREALAS